MEGRQADARAEHEKLFPIGARGYYLSLNGPESPKHGQRCEIIAHIGGLFLLRFDDPMLGVDTVGPEQFYPR